MLMMAVAQYNVQFIRLRWSVVCRLPGLTGTFRHGLYERQLCCGNLGSIPIIRSACELVDGKSSPMFLRGVPVFVRGMSETERTSSRDHVDVSFSRPHHRLVFRQQSSLQAHDTRRPTRPNHSPFRPHCPFPFIFPFFHVLVLLSLEQRYRHKSHYHAAAVRSLLFTSF